MWLQGFTNAEIALQYGIILSVRTVKQILKRLRLRRAKCNNELPLEQVVSSILEELENLCGSFMGYRQFTRHLRQKYTLRVTKENTVMRSLNIIDREGVDRRKGRRLKRQRYISPSPNFLWHVDGWDKLAHFGILAAEQASSNINRI